MSDDRGFDMRGALVDTMESPDGILFHIVEVYPNSGQKKVYRCGCRVTWPEQKRLADALTFNCEDRLIQNQKTPAEQNAPPHGLDFASIAEVKTDAELEE